MFQKIDRLGLTLTVLYLLVTPLFSQESSETNKKTLALFDFQSKSISASELSAVSAQFETAMFTHSPYTIISSSDRDRILEEMNFSLSGIADESTGIEAGKLLSAHYIALGSIELINTRYYINTRIIETESSRMISNVRREYSSIQAVMNNIDNMAKELSAPPKTPREPIKLTSSGSLSGLLSIPVSTDLVNPGYGVEARYGLSLESMDYLILGLNVRGSRFPIRTEGGFLLSQGGVFLMYRLPPISIMQIEALASAGYWYGLVSDDADLSGGNIYFRGGILASMPIRPDLSLGLEGSYTINRELFDSASIGLFISYHISVKEESENE